jgi:hypothetical protein
MASNPVATSAQALKSGGRIFSLLVPMAAAWYLWEGNTLVSSRSGGHSAQRARGWRRRRPNSPLVTTVVSTLGGCIGECASGHYGDLRDGGATASTRGRRPRPTAQMPSRGPPAHATWGGGKQTAKRRQSGRLTSIGYWIIRRVSGIHGFRFQGWIFTRTVVRGRFRS